MPLPVRRLHSSALVALLVLILPAAAVQGAGPLATTGDTSLRHDVQLLADYGVLDGPVTTWPLAWGPLLEALQSHADTKLPSVVRDAAFRLERRASWETRAGFMAFNARAAISENSTRIRGFDNTPRGRLEAGGGLAWIGDRTTVVLAGQIVDRAGIGAESRADGSLLGIALGNWLLSANSFDRWWGPGYDGSLVLSNNARPVPAVSLDRNFTDAFDNRWLSWLGPWDLSMMMGQLESDRAVPNALLFAVRFSFRPLSSLEVGLSRSAQWCGDGRPCNASTFADLLLGQDNRGDDDISIDSEPGNQLAGLDFRWTQTGWGLPTAFYGQFMGEDEAGGLPSRFLGLIGVEAWGQWEDRWSWRAFGEFAGTSCQFYESSERFNCAYNHKVYETGYRYRGRSIGHGADNDARSLTVGLIAVDAAEHEWQLQLRSVQLNRGGAPDMQNTLTPVPKDMFSIDLSHSRAYWFGIIEVGMGYESTDSATAGSVDEGRAFLQWRSGW